MRKFLLIAALLVPLTSCTEIVSFGLGFGAGYFTGQYMTEKEMKKMAQKPRASSIGVSSAGRPPAMPPSQAAYYGEQPAYYDPYNPYGQPPPAYAADPYAGYYAPPPEASYYQPQPQAGYYYGAADPSMVPPQPPVQADPYTQHQYESLAPAAGGGGYYGGYVPPPPSYAPSLRPQPPAYAASNPNAPYSLPVPY